MMMIVGRVRKRVASFLIMAIVGSVIGSGGMLGYMPSAQAAEVWKPMDTEPMIVPGSAMDLSSLNQSTVGQNVYIQQGADGDYTLEPVSEGGGSGQPGKKVKLYGANLTWNMLFDTQEGVDKTVDRLSRAGYNVVRLHTVDSMASWSPGIFEQNYSTTPQLNSAQLEKLDYLIAKLKSKGIFITIDLFQLYDFKGIPNLGNFADASKSAYLLPLLPQALDMWKSIVSAWLTHENAYTHIALKDDPVLVGVSPWNENLLLNMRFDTMSTDLQAWLFTDFNNYLTSHNQPNITSFPADYWNAPLAIKNHLSAYYSEKTIAVSNAMRAYLKNDLHVKAPVGGLNYIYSPNVNYWRDQGSDVFETHAYNQFVDTKLEGGSVYQYNPLKFPRLSMAFNSATAANYPKAWATDTHFGSYYPALSLRQPYNKPFVLTEFQDTQPAKGREDVGIFNGAIGAYQGWDMMNRYSFGTNAGDAYKNVKLGAPEQFSIVGDPLAIVSEAEATLLFRNEAIQAAEPSFVFVWDRTWSSNTAAASESIEPIKNLMYIPHLFKTVTVYADQPNEPFAVYKITPELTPAQIASGVLPAANKLAITSSMSMKEAAEVFINALDDPIKKGAMLAALNQNKLMSDTGELVFDLNLDTYTVNTPKAIALAGSMNNHPFTLGPATVTGDVNKGTFFASSLDGNALSDSNRLLIAYTTDVAGTGEQYEVLSSGDIKYHRGVLPTLLKQQTANFTLTTNKATGGFKAYKLALNGARVQEIPVTVNGQVLSLALDTDKGFTFELVDEPQYATGFESGAADWTAISGSLSLELESSGNHVYTSTAPSSAIVSQTSGTDYFIESDVRMTGSASKFGLLARYASSGDNYSFLYDALQGKALIEKQLNGQSTVLQTVSGLTLPAGSWSKLRLEAAGSTLNGYINGQLIATATDSSIGSGAAGIAVTDVGSSASVSYDHFLVVHQDHTPPTVPTGVTAAAQSATEVTLNWTPAADLASIGRFLIIRDGQQVAEVVNANGSTTSYKDTGLSLATTYHYQIKAVDIANNQSAASAEITVMTKDKLFEDNFESGSVSGWSPIWGSFGLAQDGGSNVYLSNNPNDGGTRSFAGSAQWDNYRVEAQGKMDQAKGRIGLVARAAGNDNYYSMTYDNYTQQVYISKVLNGVLSDLQISPKIPALAAGVYHTFAFNVTGNLLQAYINGQLVANVTDPANSFPKGKIGVYTHMLKGYFDDVVVKPELSAPDAPTGLTASALSSSEVSLSWAQASDDTGVTGYEIYRNGQFVAAVDGMTRSYKDTGLSITTTYHYTIIAKDGGNHSSPPSSEAVVTTKNTLFDDNFESGSASRWTVVGNWGTFSVGADVYGSLAYLSDNAANGATKSVAGSSWINYSVEAKGRMTTASGRMGVVARYADYNNFYSMTYDNYSKRVYISKVVGGVQSDIAISNAISPLAADVYHTLRFTVNGNTLQAYVNGVLIVSATDSSISAGKIGVYSHLSKVYFDDVVVNPVP